MLFYNVNKGSQVMRAYLTDIYTGLIHWRNSGYKSVEVGAMLFRAHKVAERQPPLLMRLFPWHQGVSRTVMTVRHAGDLCVKVG